MTAFVLIEVTSENFSMYRQRIMDIERSSFFSPWPAWSFNSELRNPLSRLWAVADEVGIAGFACFWTVAGEIHLLNIAVDPRRRGKGAGSFLLGRLLEEGGNTGVERIWLEVRPSNSAALRLYRKAGFITEGRRARYYGDTGEDAIVMSLSPLSLDTTGWPGHRTAQNRAPQGVSAFSEFLNI